jgi:hypothetical protein
VAEPDDASRLSWWEATYGLRPAAEPSVPAAGR